MPKDPQLMVVYGLTESEDGAIAIQAELARRGLSPVRLTNAPGPAYEMPGVRYCSKLSVKGFWSFLRAGVVFTSHPLYGGLARAPGQRIVLFWHGEVVKPVGLLDGDRAVVADLAPVCSSVGRAFRSAELGVNPLQVPIVGAPRNDRMLSADGSEVRNRLGWGAGEWVWLWLPTYRASVRGHSRSDTHSFVNGLPYDEESLHKLDSLLVERAITVVIKPHPLSEQSISGDYTRLRVMPQAEVEACGTSLYEMLAAADGLVTDVSSVWIDYLLLQRPLVFAFPDLDEYRLFRGVNLEPYEDWVPGPVVTDVTSFAERLADCRSGDDVYGDQRRLMLRRFHRYADAGSAHRLLDLLDLPPTQTPTSR